MPPLQVMATQTPFATTLPGVHLQAPVPSTTPPWHEGVVGSLTTLIGTQLGGVPVVLAGHTATVGGVVGGAGTTQFGGVPVWPAGHVVTLTGVVGLGTSRRQFGGVPTRGGVHAAAVTQFGGVPVWPGAQNFLLP